LSTLVLELHYLGNWTYFKQLLQAPKVLLEAQEHYHKGSYRNRCHLMSSRGLSALSIPLSEGKHQQKPILEVAIDNKQRWQVQHWRSLQTFYGSAPYWPYYAPYLEPLYLEQRWERLWDFNFALLEVLLQRCFRLSPPLELSSRYEKSYGEGFLDLRGQISPKQSSPTPYYPQVFEDRLGFLPDLSVLDALFCLGGAQTLRKMQQQP
jgi:hypothetical protein